jgi:carbonic anhydrase/acetyltransferase-like protein (isoleucine patch superfamily)
MTASDTRVIAFDGTRPVVDDSAWTAPGVTLVGAVRLAARSSVWFGTVLRADGDSIEAGERSNFQDGCVVHADPGLPVSVGRGVSVGHSAVLHGCTIEDDVLVGMSATVLNGAHIGSGSLVAAGTVVLEGSVIPSGSLVAGVPGKVRRTVTEKEFEEIRRNADTYVDLAHRYAAQTPAVPR